MGPQLFIMTATTAVAKRIVVAGGSGFLGKITLIYRQYSMVSEWYGNLGLIHYIVSLGARICQSAVARGWEVVSLRCASPSCAKSEPAFHNFAG